MESSPDHSNIEHHIFLKITPKLFQHYQELWLENFWRFTKAIFGNLPTAGNIEGGYDPDSDGLTELFEEEKALSSSKASSTPSRRKRRAVTSLTYRGLSNPTICLTHGSHMIWRVSNSDYPKYEKTNLYNTNPNFDDGPFKALEERHELESTKFELFAYKFDTEGVYVFTSSANPESVMVSLTRIYKEQLICLIDLDSIANQSDSWK